MTHGISGSIEPKRKKGTNIEIYEKKSDKKRPIIVQVLVIILKIYIDVGNEHLYLLNAKDRV